MPLPMPPAEAYFAETLRHARDEGVRGPATPVSAERSGARYLDVSRHGDVAILQDADGEFLAAALDQGMDLNWIMDSLYGAYSKNFDDEYDYVTFFLLRDFGLFFAFYQPYANDVTGIGYDSMVPGQVFDQSSTQMQGLIFMNYYGMWTEEPEQGRFVFGQEFLHRWAAFVDVDHEGVGEEELLGRDVAHWSYWLDTPNSPMEGNDWTDNGDGTFTIDQASGSGYSDLDLYLAGLIGPEEVAPMTLLQVPSDEQARVEREAASTPEYFNDTFEDADTTPITVSANPVAFTLDDILAAEGERVPSVADSPKSFRMGFAVLALSDDDVNADVLDQIDALRATFASDWEEDVGGRATLDTTLGAGVAPEWGTPVDTGDSGAPADTAGKTEEPAACGCAAAPAPGWALPAWVAVLALRRRRALG